MRHFLFCLIISALSALSSSSFAQDSWPTGKFNVVNITYQGKNISTKEFFDTDKVSQTFSAGNKLVGQFGSEKIAANYKYDAANKKLIISLNGKEVAHFMVIEVHNDHYKLSDKDPNGNVYTLNYQKSN